MRVFMFENHGSVTLIDLDDGLGRVRGNKKLFVRMLGLFMDSTEFAALEEALGQGDIAKIEHSAHTIKGIAGNLSLTALFNVSTELMQQARNGATQQATIDEYRATLEATKGRVTEVIAQMSAEV